MHLCNRLPEWKQERCPRCAALQQAELDRYAAALKAKQDKKDAEKAKRHAAMMGVRA